MSDTELARLRALEAAVRHFFSYRDPPDFSSGRRAKWFKGRTAARRAVVVALDRCKTPAAGERNG